MAEPEEPVDVQRAGRPRRHEPREGLARTGGVTQPQGRPAAALQRPEIETVAPARLGNLDEGAIGKLEPSEPPVALTEPVSSLADQVLTIAAQAHGLPEITRGLVILPFAKPSHPALVAIPRGRRATSLRTPACARSARVRWLCRGRDTSLAGGSAGKLSGGPGSLTLGIGTGRLVEWSLHELEQGRELRHRWCRAESRPVGQRPTTPTTPRQRAQARWSHEPPPDLGGGSRQASDRTLIPTSARLRCRLLGRLLGRLADVRLTSAARARAQFRKVGSGLRSATASYAVNAGRHCSWAS